MFFFIPVGTDAPIYYWPYATVGLIIANVLVWLLGPDEHTYALVYGNGLHPIQWVTSNFMHGGFLHLLGNMIFLWGFGIIVEGKLGWWRFLLVYLGMGVFECMLEQIAMLRVAAPDNDRFFGSLGASSIIYGLTAMSLVWAPKNELTILFFLFFIRVIVRIFDVSVMGFVLFQIFWEVSIAVLLAWLGIASPVSSVLHMAGAAIGFAVGVFMLKMKWVDCERWDLFSVMQGKHQQIQTAPAVSTSFLERDYRLETSTSEPRRKKKKKKKRKRRSMPSPLDADEVENEIEDDVRESRANKRSKGLKRVKELLAEGKPNAALSEYKSLRRSGGVMLPAPDLLALANALFKEQQWEDVSLLFQEYVDRFPEIADEVRLRLSGIFVEKQQRPMAALRLLQEIPPKSLTDKQEKYRSQVERRANQLIDDGVIELEGRSWR